MSQELRTQQTTGTTQPSSIASDPSTLTDAELALVVGGTDGPGGIGDTNGRSGA